MTSLQPGLFFSLKWKALLLSSLVLIAVTGTLVAINHHELQSQFQRRRVELQSQYAYQVQGLLEQSDKTLRKWSATIASSLNLHGVTGKALEERMIAEFERMAASLELNMGMEKILLMTADGQRLAAHGPGAAIDSPANVVSAVRQALATETPVGLIDCSETCLQYAITPILDAGTALVMGISLADIVLDFRRVSGTDLGLLVGGTKLGSSNGNGEQALKNWNLRVVALFNARANLAILRQAAHQQSLAEAVHEPLYVMTDQREHQVRLFPLTGFEQGWQAYLAIIADITDSAAHISAALRRNVLLGLLGLVLSEVLLLAILWLPMSGLRRAADNLPWLAEGAFGKVRAAILEAPLNRRFRDEVDVLNETAIALSHQLEALHIELANHTHDLSERMDEITRQRNFVTHLLEVAQVLILTQNHNNEILMVNPYAEAITGYAPQELRGRPFASLLSVEEDGTKAQFLTDLQSSDREHIEVECDISCKDGGTLNIVWQHSRLKGQATDNAVILSVGMDITARKRAEMRLAWLADHDTLTGLYNRRRFAQELKEAVAAARRYGYSGALLFVDLDQFKYINDTSGHQAGDRLLQRLGEMFGTILREVDVISRLGGDEFAVVLKRATANEAIQVAKKLLSHIEAVDFSVDEQIHRLSASIGITLFPEYGATVEDLLARADLAMYRVKESGRGGWHLLSDQDQTQRLMRERVFWKQRVEVALKEKRFLLYAQPIMNIRTRAVSHYEVLLRMRGDDDEIIGPAQFIEVAERSGLIHPIDRMVMSDAIHYQARALARGLPITLTVNLSAHAFNDPDLLQQLKRLLQETGLDPQKLIFEMTETAALADIAATRQLMEAINAIGCQFALDDFGTGFSSFYYLKTLPFGFIKIDGSFIHHLGERADDQVLVKAMAEIARAFGKKTVAEHVEDSATLALLADYGIDYAQGYYVGRPEPITRVLQEPELVSAAPLGS